MKEKIARRSVLTALGTAAAVGTVGCRKNEATQADSLKGKAARPRAVPDQRVLPRVNLICHGMMLFWQDRGTPSNGITIYAPNAGGMHKVSLGMQIGGNDNKFKVHGEYTLRFDCSNKTPLGRMPADQNLVIYDPPDTNSEGLAATGMAEYILHVPYPSQIRSYRVMQFGSTPPYATGPGNDTTSTFKISPTQLTGLNVLTYDTVTSPVMLGLGTGNLPTLQDNPLPPILNLYLYADVDPNVPQSGDHLAYFNKLLKYNNHSALDLKVNNTSPYIPGPDEWQQDGDLSEFDLYDLGELQPHTGPFVITSSDPVGCIEGWGS